MVSVSECSLRLSYTVGYLPGERSLRPLARIILALALVRYCIRLGLTISRDAFPFPLYSDKPPRCADALGIRQRFAIVGHPVSICLANPPHRLG